MARSMQLATARDVALSLKAAHQAQRGAVVLVGAGCSMSAGIPSAGQIVDYVRVKHPQAYAAAKDRDYPSVMHQLPWQSRYALFHNLVRVAGLNWAHVALAILMQRRYVGRVMTTNFDDLVQRACALYGLYPSMHDLAVSAALGDRRHATAPLQYRDSLLREPALLYLHGRHNGFAQKHSNQQLRRQADLLRPVVASAKQRPRPWIVVGYSGESDPLFETVRQGGFPGGLFWVNLKPPSGAAERALSTAGGCFVPADADSFFLDLLRATVGGGRDLLLPSLLQPAEALSRLPAPAKGMPPASPSVAMLRAVLPQAFKPGQASQHRAQRATADAATQALRTELLRAEALWQDACAAGPGGPFLRLARLAEAAFERALRARVSRDQALLAWGDELATVHQDSTSAAAGWRTVYGRYRTACDHEALLAWAHGRAATVLAARAQQAAVSIRQLNERRAAMLALDGSVQAAAMALKVGLGDLHLAAALHKRAEATGPRAGAQVLQQAARAYLQACLAAADCPPRDHRATGAQALVRLARRTGSAALSLRQVQGLRARIGAATGL